MGCGTSKPDVGAAAAKDPAPHAVTLHARARGEHPQYPARAAVDDAHVPWAADWAEYAPVDFTHMVVHKFDCTKVDGGWADPSDWKAIAELGARLTYEPVCKVDPTSGVPLNPWGRTGMFGRGLLGKWGANHAADPIVTRYDPATGYLQMVAIRRQDTREWAIPGGMVDPGETVSVTVKREFEEEAGNVPADQKEAFKKGLETLFAPSNSRVVYKGYVDDPRNTDNAWMETCAMHFHCSDEMGANIPLKAGDDATDVRWLRISEDETDFEHLYANHKAMVLQAVASMARSKVMKPKQFTLFCETADRVTVLASVQEDGNALKWACKELQADREVVLAAMIQNEAAIQYASADIQADKEAMVAMAADRRS